MKMFKTFMEMLGDGSSVTITIAKKGEELIVSVLPGNSIVKDTAKSRIVPLNLSGTAEDLDDGFIDAISTPIAKSIDLLSNMASFEKAQEEAKAKSKMEAEKKAVEEKRKKELSDYVSLAKQNLKEEKFRDALTCIANARKVATSNDCSALDKLEIEVSKLSGAESMFGDLEDKSDGKNVKIGKVKVDNKSNNEDEEGGEE